MCCFTERLLLPNKEPSHRVPEVQCNLAQLPMRNKMRLKAGEKKHLPFANPSGAGERRISHALLGSWGSDSLTMPFPKILLPTALSAMQSTKVEVMRAAQLTSALIKYAVVLCVTFMLLSVCQ